MVKIAVCDHGIGIRQSLKEGRNDLPDDITDGGSILKALDARVSSKGQPSNEGVGTNPHLSNHQLNEGANVNLQWKRRSYYEARWDP